jgi:hypothetical protein
MDEQSVAAEADGSLNWQPVPGRHTLQLLDAAGGVSDETRFLVRGRSAAESELEK